MPDPQQRGERVYKGIAVSAGICHGKVMVLRRAPVEVPQYQVPEAELLAQVQRLQQALLETRQQILEVQRQVSQALNAKDASIFDAHLLVLEDPTLIESVTQLIQQKKINAEAAFHEFAEKYQATLRAINDPYLQERATDMRDVTSRILDNLMGRRPQHDRPPPTEPCILIAEDLPPSEVALLSRKNTLGFATDVGSRTSHSAIMARSLEIPAVVGLQSASQKIQNGDIALLDGYGGLVIVNPSEQTLFEYGKLTQRRVSMEDKLHELQFLPAVTLDGKEIVLSANIEQLGDLEAVRFHGAEGVGLFRTEYLFINRESPPTEEEQFQVYRQLAAALKPHPVIIRTLDLGGDKFLSHLKLPVEMNPFLGWRAIRFCLEEREIFRAQLRAILRAGTEQNVKLMYPMISGLGELEQANALLEEYKEELRKENIPFDPNLHAGAMIEIPSAALAADALARRCQFFSLGTNDLIQYSLAVDRLNEKIAHLYQPTHPAVVRLIKMTADAAHRAGIWCGLCGEMGSDPALTPLLLGLGLDELSTAPSLVPQVKALIRLLKMQDARKLADFALDCESGQEILARSQALARAAAPGLFADA
ncbi:MAG TPA: phosphoenolpyruvate--protein phosphotransferase [Candidatus Acidoferrum sp.]|nr:phosphoenolpyruvate--protein phosphotransferase [Candidatus Acidoferrum sp.]